MIEADREERGRGVIFDCGESEVDVIVKCPNLEAIGRLEIIADK